MCLRVGQCFPPQKILSLGGGEIEELAETGEDEIANTFSNIFKTLYNSAESSEEMVVL